MSSGLMSYDQYQASGDFRDLALLGIESADEAAGAVDVAQIGPFLPRP